MKQIILTILLWGMCTYPVYADTTWQVAPGRTSIQFKVKHLVFMEVEGKFKKFDGKVVMPNDDLTDATIEGRIQANSIYTGNHDRDDHLRGEDFFNVIQFPEIIFTSQSIVKVSHEEIYRMRGNLTILGVTRPIELEAVCSGKKKLSNGKTRMDLTVTGSLNRFDYGFMWNEVMENNKSIVGDTIDLTLNLALLKD